MRGLFISGTDTDVGKTWITSLIARQLRAGKKSVGAYKPVCSGSEPSPETGDPIWPDIEALHDSLAGKFPREKICPQQFHPPLAPNVAARESHSSVDNDLLLGGIDWWNNQVDYLLVEGVGGILCPLTDNSLVIDLAVSLRYPVLIVARLGLGTLNHSLLTIEAARSRGLFVAGIVLNETTANGADRAIHSNPAELQRLTTVPILGVCRHNSEHLQRVESDGTVSELAVSDNDWIRIFDL